MGGEGSRGRPRTTERRCWCLFEGLGVAGVRGLWELAPISKVRSRSDRNRPLASIPKLGGLSIQNRKRRWSPPLTGNGSPRFRLVLSLLWRVPSHTPVPAWNAQLSKCLRLQGLFPPRALRPRHASRVPAVRLAAASLRLSCPSCYLSLRPTRPALSLLWPTLSLASRALSSIPWLRRPKYQARGHPSTRRPTTIQLLQVSSLLSPNSNAISSPSSQQSSCAAYWWRCFKGDPISSTPLL